MGSRPVSVRQLTLSIIGTQTRELDDRRRRAANDEGAPYSPIGRDAGRPSPHSALSQTRA
jgi:hypothetical protein